MLNLIDTLGTQLRFRHLPYLTYDSPLLHVLHARLFQRELQLISESHPPLYATKPRRRSARSR